MTTTTAHAITTVTGPHEPTEPGALEYFAARCTCGHVVTSSLEGLAREWGQGHANYMNRKG